MYLYHSNPSIRWQEGTNPSRSPGSHPECSTYWNGLIYNFPALLTSSFLQVHVPYHRAQAILVAPLALGKTSGFAVKWSHREKKSPDLQSIDFTWHWSHHRKKSPVVWHALPEEISRFTSKWSHHWKKPQCTWHFADVGSRHGANSKSLFYTWRFFPLVRPWRFPPTVEP